jgi:hypothetical protein
MPTPAAPTAATPSRRSRRSPGGRCQESHRDQRARQRHGVPVHGAGEQRARPEFAGDLFVGGATGATVGGHLFRFQLNRHRTGFDFQDPRLDDRVADNVAKNEITESESLLVGRGLRGVPRTLPTCFLAVRGRMTSRRRSPRCCGQPRRRARARSARRAPQPARPGRGAANTAINRRVTLRASSASPAATVSIACRRSRGRRALWPRARTVRRPPEAHARSPVTSSSHPGRLHGGARRAIAMRDFR